MAGLGALIVLPWLFVTAIETDSSWEDAIWQSSGFSKTIAWIALACGAVAAAGALASALRFRSQEGRRSGIWLLASLGVELVAAAGWVAAALTAPS